MKAILIDPNDQTVKLIDIPNEAHDSRTVLTDITFAITNSPGSTSLRAKVIVKPDGSGINQVLYSARERQTRVRVGFKLGGKTYAGKAVILGSVSDEDGYGKEWTSTILTVDGVQAMIEWLDRGVHY